MDCTKLCECGCGGILPVPDRPSHQTRFLGDHRSRLGDLHPPRQPLQGLSPEERFWHHVTKTNECWEWTGVRKDNGRGLLYGVFRTYDGPKDKGGRQRYAHRYSWELHNGPIPNGLLVCHHCDNPPCVRPDHLFLGTAVDNNRDMNEKGRHGSTKGISTNRGANNPNASLDETLVRFIRRRYYSEGQSQKRIARELGCTAGTVQSVIEGKTWGWLPNEDGTEFVHRSRMNTPRGESVNLAKLTAEQVRAIRLRYATERIGAERLGSEYDVSKHCVLEIVHRRTWKHILDNQSTSSVQRHLL